MSDSKDHSIHPGYQMGGGGKGASLVYRNRVGTAGPPSNFDNKSAAHHYNYAYRSIANGPGPRLTVHYYLWYNANHSRWSYDHFSAINSDQVRSITFNHLHVHNTTYAEIYFEWHRDGYNTFNHWRKVQVYDIQINQELSDTLSNDSSVVCELSPSNYFFTSYWICDLLDVICQPLSGRGGF